MKIKKVVYSQMYMLKKQWKISKGVFFIRFISAVIDGVVPIISVWLSKKFVEVLLEKDFKNTMIIMAFTLLLNVFNFLQSRILFNELGKKGRSTFNIMNMELLEKRGNMDLALKEDPSIAQLGADATAGIGSRGADQLLKSVFELFSYFITFFSVVTILSSVRIWILAIILLVILLQSWITYKGTVWQHEVWQEDSQLGREASYAASLMDDRISVVESSINPLIKWFLQKYDAATKKRMALQINITRRELRRSSLMEILSGTQNVVLYLYMVWQVIFNDLSYADFTMFIASIGILSGTISGIVKIFIGINSASMYLDHYIKYLEIKNVIKIDKEDDIYINENHKGDIDFKNVDFSYPGSENLVLKDINLHIEKDKFYVIVGPNGSGKSTFIKLLCRLYDPVDGSIYMGDNDIKRYNYRSYHNMFSAVFQQYKIFDYTVGENVALDKYEDTDECNEKVISCLKKAGIWEKVKSLKHGIYTRLGRAFDDEGVYLSGGETQKIALARALFRDADIMILDEPSSALDAFAEDDLLQLFLNASRGKTVFYISHRLSGARYAYKVIFIEEGKISGFDTHENLMKSNKRYCDMYTAQAKHYNSSIENK